MYLFCQAVFFNEASRGALRSFSLSMMHLICQMKLRGCLFKLGRLNLGKSMLKPSIKVSGGTVFRIKVMVVTFLRG